MRYHQFKVLRDNQKNHPFVCLFTPFVSIKNQLVIPSICKNKPFVCNKTFGFTLIELIITVTIIGIVAAIAVPGMNTFTESNRLTTLTNDLIADINLAKSEAIKRGVQTAICGSPTSPSCAGGANWNGGWLVFADADDSGTWSTGDIQIKIREVLPQNSALTPPASTIIMVISRMGTATSGSGTYTVCNSKIKKKRDININSLGRTSLSEGSC